MSAVPFYFTTLDGADPCSWAPFGVPLESMSSRRDVMPAEYSNTLEFSISILCRSHDTIADEAISQSIGCLVDGEYLKPERASYIDQQFKAFGNRLSSLNTVVIETLGFEIYFILNHTPSKQNVNRAMQFKQRLILSGIAERLLRVDFIRDQDRLTEISQLRLSNIASMKSATRLAQLAGGGKSGC